MRYYTEPYLTISGIPRRSDAERALAAAQGGGRLFFFAASFVADFVTELLDEGDCNAADSALLQFFCDLSERLPERDRIYRWTGTSLLVLMERSVPPEAVQREMDAVPVIGKREVFPLRQGCTTEQLCRRIDLFVARNLVPSQLAFGSGEQRAALSAAAGAARGR